MASQTPRIRVIDADTHLTEPVDLWTARIPERFRDGAPRVLLHEPTGTWRWRWGTAGAAWSATTAWPGGGSSRPSCPPTLEEADPACYDAKARLAHMDANGIYAQVLYPNVIAFEGHAFMALTDDELKLACVRTYNDYQIEFASIAPGPLRPLAVLPFWDLEASMAELRRCHGMGHQGRPVGGDAREARPPRLHRPALGPALRRGPGSRHVDQLPCRRREHGRGDRAGHEPGGLRPGLNAARSSMSFISNARTIGLLLTSGLCDRFPRLDFVSVESGFGYVPFLLDSLDWQWVNARRPRALPRPAAAERVLPAPGVLHVLVRDRTRWSCCPSTRTT